MAHHEEISGGAVGKINNKIIKEIQAVSYLEPWKEPKERNNWMQMIILFSSVSKVRELPHNDQYFLILFAAVMQDA